MHEAKCNHSIRSSDAQRVSVTVPYGVVPMCSARLRRRVPGRALRHLRGMN